MISENVKWYPVSTLAQNEKKACAALLNKGIETYLPLRRQLKQWSDRKKKVETPLFRSYVFVNIDDYAVSNHMVLDLPGVVRFLWWQGKPGIVKEQEIEAIKDFMFTNKGKKIVVEMNISPGDNVNIIAGPLVGQSGRMIASRGKNVVLELSSFGCKLTAMVSLINIEPKV